MDMEELDAELLAVTDGQKRASRSVANNGSDSEGGEFDGVADSDGPNDEDDDAFEDDNNGEDDDDDDEYGLDDTEDADYRSKSSKRRQGSRGHKGKKSTKTGRNRSKGKSAPGKLSGTGEKARFRSPVGDADQFEHEYDQDGYGDAADRDRLARMNEVDREFILAERIEARSKEYLLWKKKQEMMARDEESAKPRDGKRSARSSGRSKQSSKSDALQALAEDKRKKFSRPADLEVSDADSEPDRPGRRNAAKHGEAGNDPHQRESLRDDDGPNLKYSDLVTIKDGIEKITSPLFLRREELIQLSQQPYFERVVIGRFARIRAVSKHDNSYLLCRVVGVKTGKVYEVGQGLRTNWMLILQTGKQRKPFEIRLTSGSHPSEAEFDWYVNHAVRDHVDVPRRDEVAKLLKRAHDMMNRRSVVATDEELRRHVANTEAVYPERVNWTQKLTEAKTALDIKNQDLVNAQEQGDAASVAKYKSDVEELQRRLVEVRRLEDKYTLRVVQSNAEVFQSLAKRNMALNSTSERFAANRSSLESSKGGANPFARFDTTGQSYFSIRSKATTEGAETVSSRRLLETSDWRNFVSSWSPSMKRRRMRNPVDVAYDIPLPSLNICCSALAKDFSQPQFSATPAAIDAEYAESFQEMTQPPKNAKFINFEEWSSQRVS